jgi:dCMP deaminase
MSWHEYFFRLCLEVARKSKDRSIRVGCILAGPDHEIRSAGFNGFPMGVQDNDEKYHGRPLKYLITQHAERNAISLAARAGTSLKDCTAYISLPPCAQCAGGLIQAGIENVLMLDAPEWWSHSEAWEEDFRVAKELLLSSLGRFEFVSPSKIGITEADLRRSLQP